MAVDEAWPERKGEAREGGWLEGSKLIIDRIDCKQGGWLVGWSVGVGIRVTGAWTTTASLTLPAVRDCRAKTAVVGSVAQSQQYGGILGGSQYPFREKLVRER